MARSSSNASSRYLMHRDRPGVTVFLTDGSEHRHISATHDDRSESGARSCFYIATSYEVLPSGALAIVQSQVWEEGWPPLVNDDVRIVATYAPHQWARVIGTCEVDPHHDRFQAQRKILLDQQDAATASAQD